MSDRKFGEIYRKFISKYKIPEEEMDGFIIQTNKPMLLELIANIRDAIEEVLEGAERELSEE